jgi:spermidine synthase
VANHFPITRNYLAFIPTYQSGMWSFVLGSKVHDPLVSQKHDDAVETRYYTEALHKACFVLPRFVQELSE